MSVHLHHALLLAAVAISLFTVATSFSMQSPSKRISLRTSHQTPFASLQASTADSTESQASEKTTLLADNDLIKTLDDALKFNTSSASIILEKIQTIRSSGGSQEEVDEILDTILSTVDGGVPLWARFRPLTRFSSRARRASLRRVLDLSTPTLEETDAEIDVAEATKRSRRRSLVVLLRTLVATEKKEDKRQIPSIRLVEKEARREAKEGATSEEMATRLPPGLETPDYSIVVRRPAKKGAYEVRKYKAYSMCTVPMTKPRPLDASKTDAKVSNPQLSGASSFGALAGYLFGKNSESTAMKMTTPVLTMGDDGEDQTMSFVMPSDYWDEGGIESRAPQPLEGSGVRLERDVGGYRAAVMFGGYASKAEVKRRKLQLIEGLKKDKEYDVIEGAPIGLAQYNDPFTPPWKRRNEVFVTVAPRDN